MRLPVRIPLSAPGTLSAATLVLQKVEIYFQVYPGTTTTDGTDIGIPKVPYTINGVAGGVTDASGKVEVLLPVGGSAALEIFGTTYTVTAQATLEPATTVAGQQRRLEMLGYDLGATGVDGSMGQRTEKAIHDFQCDANLDMDCVVGSATRAALASGSWAGE